MNKCMRCGLPYFDEEAHKSICIEYIATAENDAVKMGEGTVGDFGMSEPRLNKTMDERKVTEQALMSTIQILRKAEAARKLREQEKR